MTHTKQFIEDAIEGGWKKPVDKKQCLEFYMQSNCKSSIFLDPKAWQAVGKTRGWDNGYPDEVYEAWDYFFSNLYEGLSIEEALAAIA